MWCDDRAGRVLLTSHAADPQDFPTFATDWLSSRPKTCAFIRRPPCSGTIALTIAEPLSHRREVAREMADCRWPCRWS
jgi:two-component system OmpR family sensor kinase